MSSAGVCCVAMRSLPEASEAVRDSPAVTAGQRFKPPGFGPRRTGTGAVVSEPTYESGEIQQSSQQGPGMDEYLKQETRGLVQGGRSTRAEEWRAPEPAGEDQPTADRIFPEDRR